VARGAGFLLLTSFSFHTIGEAIWPRSRSSGCAENGPLRPNIALADQGDLVVGDTDLADRLRLSVEGDVFKRGSLGTAGGGRGVRYLSSGFIVFITTGGAPSETLLSRSGVISTGTCNIFTCWPGRNGHEAVDGSVGSWISVPSPSSY
jgi:hypothetical protein